MIPGCSCSRQKVSARWMVRRHTSEKYSGSSRHSPMLAVRRERRDTSPDRFPPEASAWRFCYPPASGRQRSAEPIQEERFCPTDQLQRLFRVAQNQLTPGFHLQSVFSQKGIFRFLPGPAKKTHSFLQNLNSLLLASGKGSMMTRSAPI